MVTPREIIRSHLPTARRHLLEAAVILDAYEASVRRHGRSAECEREMRRFRQALNLLRWQHDRGKLEDQLWALFGGCQPKRTA